MGCLYTTKVGVNVLTFLAFLGCGIALLVLPPEDFKSGQKADSLLACGGAVVVLSFIPIIALLNWTNMHKDFHKATARQFDSCLNLVLIVSCKVLVSHNFIEESLDLYRAPLLKLSSARHCQGKR